MNIVKKLLCAGFCVSALLNATADVIPASALERPEGCVVTGESEYLVGVSKRANIANTTPGMVFTPDVKKIAGKAVKFSADLRCREIASDAEGEHIGGKILIVCKDSAGNLRFYGTKPMTGTVSDWQHQFVNLEIPANTKEVSVVFGIQQGWGQLDVRNPRMDFVTFGLPADGAKTPIPMDAVVLSHTAKINGDVLSVNIPKRVPMPNETIGGSVFLDLGNMREKLVKVSGRMRYDMDSDATASHIGAKVLGICYDKNSGNTPTYCGSEPRFGSSADEWKEFSGLIKVYDSTTSVKLTFGIQQGWGKAEFRDLAMEVIGPIDGTPSYEIPENFKCEYSQEVLSAAPRRGFMTPVPGHIKADDIREMGKWGANLIRYQMVDGIEHEPENVQAYMTWLNNCLDKLDSLMPVLKENNIKVVIDMHQVVGGRYRMGKRPPQTEAAEEAVKLTGKYDLHRIFCEEDMRHAFIEAWKMIAKRYKDNPVIFAYDLVNEPYVTGQSPYHLLDVQYDAAKAIREIDPETPIMIEGNRSASAVFFNVRPMPLKNIFYEIHMYYPGDYCFQGVSDLKTYTKHYPQSGIAYDLNKEGLRAAMKRVIDFKEKYGAKIYVGEFTVPRWVPDGGGKYLDDLISLFEEYKWDWTFHAFREWNGFSPEHYGTPDNPQVGDNERKSILQKYFKRNVAEQ